MFRKPAVAVVILLTILAVPAAAWAQSPPGDSHTATMRVPPVDAIRVEDDGSVTVILVKRDDGMGFVRTESSDETMSLFWASNGSSRSITVEAAVPTGAVLELKKDKTWIGLEAKPQTWVSTAGREAGWSGVQSLKIVYIAWADLRLPPGSYDVTVKYTLTGS